jgi:hypothetical protein
LHQNQTKSEMENYEKYPIIKNKDSTTFDFISVGKKGRISKRIIFQPYESNIYNLAFGDLNEATQKIDDKVVTDNGDSIKVLATVAQAVYWF